MEDIAGLIVRQFRVFPPDVIPINALSTGPGSEAFRKQFQFREVIIPEQAVGELLFAGGMFIFGDREHPIVINYVQVNAQRIIIEVVGDSETAELVFTGVVATLTAFDPQQRLAQAAPLLFTQETQCVARLAVEWTDLISDRLGRFLGSSAVSSIKSGGAESVIAAMNLRFTLQFQPSDQRLRAYGVIHADKTLILEPRLNTPFSERQYFTQSPLDSLSHLKLIEEFEQAVSGTSRKRART